MCLDRIALFWMVLTTFYAYLVPNSILDNIIPSVPSQLICSTDIDFFETRDIFATVREQRTFEIAYHNMGYSDPYRLHSRAPEYSVGRRTEQEHFEPSSFRL